MSKVFLSLGTNLGDRIEILKRSHELINKRIGSIVSASSVYQTEPWGFHSEMLFLNQVIIILTHKLPTEVLRETQTIENELGRIRTSKFYEPRFIDIDILFYDDLIINETDLQIPHPHLHERKFILSPLIDMAPEYVHPVLKINLQNLALNCRDSHFVEIYKDQIDLTFTLIHEI
jgi:2-amino-4-hydroxy-6-hydroxymethyldihydropteridine diphosphokinase